MFLQIYLILLRPGVRLLGWSILVLLWLLKHNTYSYNVLSRIQLNARSFIRVSSPCPSVHSNIFPAVKCLLSSQPSGRGSLLEFHPTHVQSRRWPRTWEDFPLWFLEFLLCRSPVSDVLTPNISQLKSQWTPLSYGTMDALEFSLLIWESELCPWRESLCVSGGYCMCFSFPKDHNPTLSC